MPIVIHVVTPEQYAVWAEAARHDIDKAYGSLAALTNETSAARLAEATEPASASRLAVR
jgi:cytochrome c oxidase subunit II